MSLHAAIKMMRRQWVWILIPVLLGGTLGWGIARVSSKTFAASTVLFVTATDDANAAALSQGATYIQNQIRSYPMLIASPAVVQGVERDTGLGGDGTLTARVSAIVPTDTSLINITVTAGSPVEATILANGFAKHFTEQIIALEARPGSDRPPVAVTVVEPAVAHAAPVKPVVRDFLLIALGIGALVGLITAAIRESISRL